MDQHFRHTQLIRSIVDGSMAAPGSAALLEEILGNGDTFFVQVGANDGEQNEPLIKSIRRNHRLRGLMIEPLAHYYDKLVNLHRYNLDRLNLCQAFISHENGMIPFYYIDPAIADEMNGDGPPNNLAHNKGSANRDTVIHWIEENSFRGMAYKDHIQKYIDSIIETRLECIPLSQLTCSERFPTIDALVIDVRGYELEVLKSANLSTRRPRFIYYEDDAGADRWIDNFLTANGYKYLSGRVDKIYFDVSAFPMTHLQIVRQDTLCKSGHQAVDKIVSLCKASHVDVWKVAARRILRCISAKKYEVVVPDSAIDIFKQNTPHQYEIRPESDYANGLDIKQIEAVLPEERRDRAGWYLQQLLKLEACRTAEHDEDIVLIWDTDTIPMRDLQFITPDGRLILRTSNEFHRPYFAAIKKLIGLPRLAHHSFIAQCFPARSRWVRALASAIEARHGVHYFDAILRCAEKSDISGFSEYETLGTFVFHHYNHEIAFSSSPWSRRGRAVFGSLRNFVSIMSKMDLEYVTFEDWESIPPKRVCTCCGRAIA